MSNKRKEALMPKNKPRYIRVYDNGGKTFDRYTVVFTGRYRKDPYDDFVWLGMSQRPFHPLGFGQHGWEKVLIDQPKYSHLGKKISFEELPEDCQKLTIQTYKKLWNISSN